MNSKILVGVVVAVILGVGLSLWQMQSPVAPTIEVSNDVKTNTGVSTTGPSPQIVWHLSHTGVDESVGAPVTSVKLAVDGRAYDAGSYKGDCIVADIDFTFASGEVAALTCWWGGAGREYGVFTEEQKLVLKTAELDEEAGDENSRVGEFKLLMPLDTVVAGVRLPSADAVRAYTLSNTALETELLAGLKALTVKYDTALGSQMSDLMREYAARSRTNAEIDDLSDAMVTTYGPCWGIPEGECRE